MADNRTVGEIHGCIVCGRIFNILAVYDPGGQLVDCTVTSPGGRVVPDKRQPLVACSSHSHEVVDAAYLKWQSSKSQKPEDDQEG